MKRLVIVALVLFAASATLESCASKLCPAYGSYPKERRK